MRVQAARRAERALPAELDRVLAALRARMDPSLATATTRQIKGDLTAAQSTIAAWEVDHHQAPPVTVAEVEKALDDAGDLGVVLSKAEREPRARLYRALDLDRQLDPVQKTLTGVVAATWRRGPNCTLTATIELP